MSALDWETGEHYAYCKAAECGGCLPPDAVLPAFPIIELWAEMMKRCIAQTPQTKTVDGAVKAIVDDGAHYREQSLRLRTVGA